MLRDIIKKEILDNLLSPKFVFMFIICSVLILLSVYMGVGGYLADKKVYDDDLAWDKQAMQPPNTFDQLRSGALKIYREPQMLGTLVKGVENAAGRMSHSHLTEVGISESKYESNPLTAVFGAFDLMFIVKMVLSLFAILLVYDTICGEREKGTLKLSLSNSVPRDRLILGKAIGGYISLVIPLLLPLMLSLIYLSLHPQIVLPGEDWQRLGLIFLMFLMYLSVFFCLGLLVSSLTTRSSTSLIALLFIWSVWGMVVPKAAVIIAGMLRPVPAPNEIYSQKAMASNQINQEIDQAFIPRLSAAGVTVHLSNGTIRGIRIPSNEAMEAYRKINDEMNLERARREGESNAKIDQEYQLRKDAQAALAKNLSRVSPSSALTFSATALAQTGVDDYNRFLKAVLDYKPVIAHWFRTNSDLRNESGEYKQFDSGILSGMPRPVIEYENLNRSFTRILPDLISMTVMIVLLMGGAYFAFIRYDVR